MLDSPCQLRCSTQKSAAKGFCYRAAMTPAIRSGLILLVLVAASICSCSIAAAQHMNAAGAPCQKTGGVTLALENCFDRTYRAADAQLNQLYKQIRQVLTPSEQQQLLATQRLWLQLRDATCSAESDLYKGGDAASPAYSACLEEETRQRTADLKTIYGWVITNSK
jgi:uncharacterized protein YecT (DUF1311 family)